MEVSGQHDASTVLIPRKDPGIHWIEGCEGFRAGQDVLMKRNNSSPCQVSNSEPASCSLVSIPIYIYIYICVCVCVCVCIYIYIFFFFEIVQRPLVGQGFLILDASRLHSDTPHLVRLLWTGDRPDAETSAWRYTSGTRQRHHCIWRDSNPQS